MKNSIIILAFLFLGLLSSCNLEETNIDPNNPNEVPLKLMLPGAQNGMARSLMNENSAITGLFMQYFEGKNNTHYDVHQWYQIDNGFYIEDIWQDYYNGPLNQLHLIIEQAEEEQAYHYKAIGQIMMAWTIGTVSDCWGDVPYTQAFQGSENLHPAFDQQNEIYAAIFNMLDEAIENLDKESTLSPDVDDVLYNGDLDLWRKAAYALIARYSLHVVHKADELDFDPLQRALEAIGNSYSNGDPALAYEFGYDDGDINPYSSGKNDVDMVVHDTYADMLNGYPGADALIETQLGSSDTGPFINSDDSKAYFITYSELRFIEAEIRLRQNSTDPEAEDAMQEAIVAFLNECKVFDPSIADSLISNYAESITLNGNFEQDLETIIDQKYISLFGQVESWADFRRTGYPQLTPHPDGNTPQNPGGEIPRRYPYPLNEMLYNPDNVPSSGTNMQQRVWWDE